MSEKNFAMRAVLACLVVVGFGPSLFADEPPKQIKPVVVWTGIESENSEPSFHCMRSNDEWTKIWIKHKGYSGQRTLWKEQCPQVDFDSNMVVGLFHGERNNNSGLKVVSVTDEKTLLRIRFCPLWYSSGLDRDDRRTESYALLVIPKSTKTIVIEEDTRSLIRGSPVWTERARLSAVEPAGKK